MSLTTDNPGDVQALTADLSTFAEVRVEGGMAIVCLVGDRLRDLPDAFERIFGTLRRASIPARMVSVGASRTNVSLVVDQSAAANAVRALHAEFFACTATRANRRAVRGDGVDEVSPLRPLQWRRAVRDRPAAGLAACGESRRAGRRGAAAESPRYGK